MSETDTDDGGNSVETCQMAMEAALNKGMSFCNTQEARTEVLCRNVGLEGRDRDFDNESLLEDGIGASIASVRTRQWVVARAEELISTEEVDQPSDALNTAWREASEQAVEQEEADEEEAEQGPDTEEADDEEDPEPEDVLDEEADVDVILDEEPDEDVLEELDDE